MLPSLVRGWDGDDESESHKERRIVKLDDELAIEVEKKIGDEKLLKKILEFVFVKKWKCNGCAGFFGYTMEKCGFDFWSEDLRYSSRMNRFHFIPYLSLTNDTRQLVNFFCDRCYESIFGNVVHMFTECVWRDTILFKCSTSEHIADQWLFHTGGEVLGDHLVSFDHFVSHISDNYEPGFVAFKLRHYDTMTRGCFRRTLMNKKIYSSERDLTSKVRVDQYYINYRRSGQEFSYWVENDIAKELFGLMQMEGPGIWTEGGRTFLYKNSTMYANACAVVISTMYPDVRREIFRRMNIQSDGTVSLIRNGGEISDIILQTPEIPVNDLEKFSHLVMFLTKILKETSY
jgi:hypothetical protein